MIKFTRPIVFFDLETTGKDVKKDQIVQYHMIKLNDQGNVLEILTDYVRPTIDISEAAFKVHGINQASLENYLDFSFHATTILKFIGDCDLAGFGVLHFDV